MDPLAPDGRTSSLATPSQREVLIHDLDITDRGERSARERIRERLRAGMVDLDLLLRELDPEQIQQALELREAPTPGEYGEEAALENGMAAAIGIVHLAGIRRQSARPDQDTRDVLEDTRFVEERAKKGIRMALNSLGESVESVNVVVDVSLGEEFSALADLNTSELADYSMTELLQAHQSGALDSDQLMAAMDAKGLTADSDNAGD